MIQNNNNNPQKGLCFKDRKNSNLPCYFVCVTSQSVIASFASSYFEGAKKYAMSEFGDDDRTLEVYKVVLTENDKKDIIYWEDLAEKITFDRIGVATPLLLARVKKAKDKTATYGERLETMPVEEIKNKLHELTADSKPSKRIYHIREFANKGYIRVAFKTTFGERTDTPTKINVNIPLRDIDMKQDPDSWFYVYNHVLEEDKKTVAFEIWGTQDAFNNIRLTGPTLMKDGTVLKEPNCGINMIVDGNVEEQIDKMTLINSSHHEDVTET